MNETTNDPATGHSFRHHRARTGRKARDRLLVGVVIAALIVGGYGMRVFDQSSRATTPTWFAACREAVDATARLHRVQDAQLAQAMEVTWAAVAGISGRASTIDQSEIARLQRSADQATRRCTAPTKP